MYYGDIKKIDTANCIGVGVSLFVSGCRNHCKNCFNPETWCFTYGKEFTSETLSELMEYCKPDYISGLTILGGDPSEPENRDTVLEICKKFKDLYPDKLLMMYTGYYIEDLIEDDVMLNIFRLLDVLIDSPFEDDKKVAGLRLRGSTNQRLIDMKKTIKDYDKNNKLDIKLFDYKNYHLY